MTTIEKLPQFTMDGKAVSTELQRHIEELFARVKPQQPEVKVEQLNSVEIFYEMEVAPTRTDVYLNARNNKLEREITIQTTETEVKVERNKQVQRISYKARTIVERVEI